MMMGAMPSLPSAVFLAATAADIAAATAAHAVVFSRHLAKATGPVDEAKEGGESESDVDAAVVVVAAAAATPTNSSTPSYSLRTQVGPVTGGGRAGRG